VFGVDAVAEPERAKRAMGYTPQGSRHLPKKADRCAKTFELFAAASSAFKNSKLEKRRAKQFEMFAHGQPFEDAGLPEALFPSPAWRAPARQRHPRQTR